MHQKHSRLVSYVATAATVAITAAMIAVGAPTASAAGRTIVVNAAISGFGTPEIHVKAGETVNITVKNTDAGIPHDLTIKDPSFQVVVAGGKTATKSFTAPTAPGTHAFICSVTGHSQTMHGNLIVDAAGAATTTTTPADTAQVKKVPAGGVQTGGGSTASGVTNGNLLTLGGGLLIAAMMSVLFGTRVARRD